MGRILFSFKKSLPPKNFWSEIVSVLQRGALKTICIKNWGCQFSTGTTWEFNRFVPERACNFTFWRDVLLPLGIYSEEILPAPKNWATLPLEGARANFWVAVHELCCSLAIGFRTNKLTYEIMLCPDLHIL